MVKVTKHDKQEDFQAKMIRTMRGVEVIVMKCYSVEEQTTKALAYNTASTD